MKNLSGILLLLLLLSGCGGNGGKNGTPEDVVLQDQLAHNREVQSQVEDWVAQTEPYVKVQPDGTLRLDRTRAVGVSPQALDFAEKSVGRLNERIAAGELTVDAGLVVRPAHPSRANENGIRYYWWGCRIALDNTRTQRLLGLLAVGAGIAALIPDAQVAAAIIAIGAGVIQWYAAPGKGIYIYRTWFPIFVWIESQR
jgi:anti-sigma28 factor (negative regulator of flagellin synthesis)